jgi:hypothetical protein
MVGGPVGAPVLCHAAEEPNAEAAQIRRLMLAERIVPAPVAKPAIHKLVR